MLNFFSISAQNSFFPGKYHCLHAQIELGCVGSGCDDLQLAVEGVADALVVFVVVFEVVLDLEELGLLEVGLVLVLLGILVLLVLIGDVVVLDLLDIRVLLILMGEAVVLVLIGVCPMMLTQAYASAQSPAHEVPASGFQAKNCVKVIPFLSAIAWHPSFFFTK